MVSHRSLITVPETSNQENPELKPPVRNGRFVAKLRSQFGFYLNLKNSSGTGHLVRQSCFWFSEFSNLIVLGGFEMKSQFRPGFGVIGGAV